MVRPGDRVSERYEVLEQLAAGGMGTLWRARHVELDMAVVLKVISASETTPTLLKRFKREAQAAARLHSPNVVQVIDYGVFEEQPYLAMELLQGEDLAVRLAREGPLPTAECLRIMDGVAKGIQLAHDAGIVHRDLKPANVFLVRVGEEELVKILDFGIAKDLGQKPEASGTTGGAAVGSPAYMSPEQVWGEDVQRQTDVWAMGVLAFEMLTGRCPFADETLAKVFERIIRAPLPRLADFSAGLPAELDAFFERALARAPAERFGSAKELMDELRRAIEHPGEPPLRPKRDGAAAAREPVAASPFATTQGRRPRKGASASDSPTRQVKIWIGLALLAFLGVGAWLLRQRPAQPPALETGRLTTPAVPRSPPELEVSTGRGSSEPSGLPQPAAPPAEPAVPAASSPTAKRRGPVVPRATVSAGSSAPAKVDPQFGIPLPH